MGTRVALRRFWVTLCGVCQLWAVGPSLGAEWSAEPSVAVRGEYNDNLSLTPAFSEEFLCRVFFGRGLGSGKRGS